MLINKKLLEEDIKNEKEFLEKLGESKPTGLKTELDIIVENYNEQLGTYVRPRFDADIKANWLKDDPDNQNIKDEKVIAEQTINLRRKYTLAVIRKHILIFLGKNE